MEEEMTHLFGSFDSIGSISWTLLVCFFLRFSYDRTCRLLTAANALLRTTGSSVVLAGHHIEVDLKQ